MTPRPRAALAALAMAAAAALLALPPAPSHAQEGASAEPMPPQIGFVHLSRVFRESAFVVRAREAANSEFAEREATIAAMIDEFNELREKLDSGAIAQDAADEDGGAVERLRELERDIKRGDRDLTEDKRARFDEVNREIEATVGETIRDVAGSRRLYLVFELSAVLYAERSLDITDDVIAALDAEPEAAAEEAEAGSDG